MINATTTYFVDQFSLDIGSSAVTRSIFWIMGIFLHTLSEYCSNWVNFKVGTKKRIFVQFVLFLLEGVCIIIFSFMNSLMSTVVTFITMSVLNLYVQRSYNIKVMIRFLTTLDVVIMMLYWKINNLYHLW